MRDGVRWKSQWAWCAAAAMAVGIVSGGIALGAEPNALRASGTEWSTFRGPGGRGVAASDRLPLTWSATDNIQWKRELPGAGASSPVVFADHIYLTAYTGYLVPGDEEGSPRNS